MITAPARRQHLNAGDWVRVAMALAETAVSLVRASDPAARPALVRPLEALAKVFVSEAIPEVLPDLSAALLEARLGLASVWSRESVAVPAASSDRLARVLVAAFAVELVPVPRWFR